MHSALHSFFHHFAGNLVRLVDVAVEMVIVCATTARANKLRKAVFAFFTGEQTGVFK